MARPKRMGAYNALDDLLPGPAWDPDPGPIDDEWNQLLLPPKLAPSAVARATADAGEQLGRHLRGAAFGLR